MEFFTVSLLLAASSATENLPSVLQETLGDVHVHIHVHIHVHYSRRHLKNPNRPENWCLIHENPHVEGLYSLWWRYACLFIISCSKAWYLKRNILKWIYKLQHNFEKYLIVFGLPQVLLSQKKNFLLKHKYSIDTEKSKYWPTVKTGNKPAEDNENKSFTK